MCKPKSNLVIIFAKRLYVCKLVANLIMNLHASEPLANLLETSKVLACKLRANLVAKFATSLPRMQIFAK